MVNKAVLGEFVRIGVQVRIQELKSEVAELEGLVRQFGSKATAKAQAKKSGKLYFPATATAAAPKKARKAKAKRKWSAKARAAVSKRMKAYWKAERESAAA